METPRRTPSSNVSQLFKAIRFHGLDTLPRVHRLMKWVEQDPKDKDMIRLLREKLADERKVQKLTPDPFRCTAPREAHHLAGDIQLGTMPHFGFPYGINVEMLVKHLLVLGMIGGGKTTVIKNLLLQILQLADPPKLMILERKQEFTELLSLPTGIHVLDANALAFNPLRPPPGIELNKWLGIFTECMVNYMDIREASSSFLVKHILLVIDEKCSSGEFPTLGDLLAFIAKQDYKAFSKDGQQKETVLNRLNDLSFHFPAMFESNRQFDIEKLMKNHCLFLLHDITHSTVQNFLMSLLMAQVFFYRKKHGGLQPSLTNLIVFDEASGLFRRKAEEQDHVPFIADLVQTARGYGIGLIAASQYSTDLAHSLLANAGTRMMVGGFGRTQDTNIFLKLRGYTEEHRRYVITHPEVGKAFIADKRWPHVVECNMALPALPPPVPMEELKIRMNESARFFEIEPVAVDPMSSPMSPPQIELSPEPKPVAVPSVESRETRVLKHIYDNHFVTVAKRSKDLKIPSVTLQKEIEKLERKKMIIRYPVHSRPSGRPPELLEIMPAGLSLIGMQPKASMKGKGGYLHQFYQLHVSQYFESQGYRVKIEGMADSKLIDVVAEKPGEECVAIEIELQQQSNSGHIVENLRNCMAAPRITRVLCLAPTNMEIKQIEELVTDHGLDRDHLKVDRLNNYMEV